MKYTSLKSKTRITLGDYDKLKKKDQCKFNLRLLSDKYLKQVCELLNIEEDKINPDGYEKPKTDEYRDAFTPEIPSFRFAKNNWYWFEIRGSKPQIMKLYEIITKSKSKSKSRKTTYSAWYPNPRPSFGEDIAYDKINKYPIYVISLGRHEYLDTAKSLDDMRLHYKIVVEPHEYDKYKKTMNDEFGEILTTPENYSKTRAEGSKHVRNFIHHLCLDNGTPKYWLLDDNIKGFYMFDENLHKKITDGSCFHYTELLMENFPKTCIGGFSYKSDIPAMDKTRYRIIRNSKVYSFLLIDTYKTTFVLNTRNIWRGDYNEDIILCIDILKKGWETFTTTQFLGNKLTTGTRKGGNEYIYRNGDEEEIFKDYLKECSVEKEVGKKVEKWNSFKKTQYLIKCFPELSKEPKKGKAIIKFSDRRKKKYHHFVDWRKIPEFYKKL